MPGRAVPTAELAQFSRRVAPPDACLEPRCQKSFLKVSHSVLSADSHVFRTSKKVGRGGGMLLGVRQHCARHRGRVQCRDCESSSAPAPLRALSGPGPRTQTHTYTSPICMHGFRSYRPSPRVRTAGWGRAGRGRRPPRLPGLGLGTGTRKRGLAKLRSPRASSASNRGRKSEWRRSVGATTPSRGRGARCRRCLSLPEGPDRRPPEAEPADGGAPPSRHATAKHPGPYRVKWDTFLLRYA